MTSPRLKQLLSVLAGVAAIALCLLPSTITLAETLPATAYNNGSTDGSACYWPDNASLSAVVPIAGEDGSYASGVVINQNRVLTAAHALSTSHRVFVHIEGQYRQARIMQMDRQEDLAMLSVDTTGIVPLPVAASDPGTNEPVWAVGYPRASGKETTPGMLTKNAAGSLHASASIDLGQSGGGLLLCQNGSYILAGMLRGYGAYVRGDQFVKLKNHSVSVGASTIQRFFNAVPQGTTYSAAMVTR